MVIHYQQAEDFVEKVFNFDHDDQKRMSTNSERYFFRTQNTIKTNILFNFSQLFNQQIFVRKETELDISVCRLVKKQKSRLCYQKKT